MDTQYAFRISPETLAKMKDIAQSQDLSIAQLMRRICKEFVENFEREARREVSE